MTYQARLAMFVADLVIAGTTPGFHAIRWRPFVRRADVEGALSAIGQELVTEGDAFALRRRVYCSAQRATCTACLRWKTTRGRRTEVTEVDARDEVCENTCAGTPGGKVG